MKIQLSVQELKALIKLLSEEDIKSITSKQIKDIDFIGAFNKKNENIDFNNVGEI